MAIISQNIYSNIPPYPSSWYQENESWGAKTVSTASDRYTITSPESVQLDISGAGFSSLSSQDFNLATASTWDIGQAVGVWEADKSYNVGESVTCLTQQGSGLKVPVWEFLTPRITGTTPDAGWGGFGVVYNNYFYKIGAYPGTNVSRLNLTTLMWEVNIFSSGSPLVWGSITNASGVLYEGSLYLLVTSLSNIYKLDLETGTWSQPTTSGTPPVSKKAHASVLYNNSMYVYGGLDNSNVPYTDIYKLDLETLAWSKPTTSGTAHTGANNPFRGVTSTGMFYLFGGHSGSSAINTTSSYNIETGAWSTVSTTGSTPSARYSGSSTVTTDNYFYLVGGTLSNSSGNSDIYRLNLSTNVWEGPLSILGQQLLLGTMMPVFALSDDGYMYTSGGVFTGAAYYHNLVYRVNLTNNTLVYRCTSSGASLSTEPTWGTTIDGTTEEPGGPIWTCQHDYRLPINRPGKDFYLYACHPSDGSNRPTFKVSPNSTIPYGYTADNSRKIGGFHCLCASMSTPATWATGQSYAIGKTVIPSATARSNDPTLANYWYRCISAHTSASEPTWTKTVDSLDSGSKWICEPIHPASGYLAGDIIPNSVWDLKHRAKSGDNTGLAYVDALDDWAGIYLVSGTATAPTNVYNGTILDTIDWNNSVDACRVIKGRLPRDSEFQVLARLSNEQTNISTGADPVTTGGHTDTQGRRMISKYFLEDCVGGMIQWLDVDSFMFHTATAHTHTWTLSGDAQFNLQNDVSPAHADVSPAYNWSTEISGYKGQLYRQGPYSEIKLITATFVGLGVYAGSRGIGLSHYKYENNNTLIGFRVIVNNSSDR